MIASLMTSRVTGAATVLGLTMESARSAAAPVALARAAPPRCVVIDLHHPGLDLPALLRDLAAVCPQSPRTIAYGSHVEAATLRAAREAGCDLVLPRCRFLEELPVSLEKWLGE